MKKQIKKSSIIFLVSQLFLYTIITKYVILQLSGLIFKCVLQTGDYLYLGVGSNFLALYYFVVSKAPILRRFIFGILLTCVNIILMWCGYYYLYCINKQLFEVDIIRMLSMLIYVSLPILIIIIIYVRLKKSVEKQK